MCHKSTSNVGFPVTTITSGMRMFDRMHPAGGAPASYVHAVARAAAAHKMHMLEESHALVQHMDIFFA